MTTTASTFPAINMDELKSIVESDNATMETLNQLSCAGSESSVIEMDKALIQQSNIVQVMSDTGFLEAVWNAYKSQSGTAHFTDADCEAFTWAIATAFQRGYMACDGLNKSGSATLSTKWVN